MTILGQDGIGRVVALAVGVAIGLRALQVARNFNEQGGLYAISGGGTVIGLAVAVGFVGASPCGAVTAARTEPAARDWRRLAPG